MMLSKKEEDEIVSRLVEQGLSYQEIGKELKKIRRKDIDEKIYFLRKQGLAYSRIEEELLKENIKVSSVKIKKTCREMFEEKGEEQPRAQRKERKSSMENQELAEKIYELRQKRLSYYAMEEELKKEGIILSPRSIRSICKKIYKEKGEQEPTSIKGKSQKQEELEKNIYELMKRDIIEVAKKYIKVDETVIDIGITSEESTGVSIFHANIPIVSIKRNINEENGNKTEENQKINERICELREEGVTYRKIKNILEEEGIRMTEQGIVQKHKRTLKHKEKQLAQGILKLMLTRKATLEQVKQMAEYYGVDLEETMNSLEER